MRNSVWRGIRDVASGLEREEVLEQILENHPCPLESKATITRMFYGSLRHYLSLRRGIKSIGRTKKLPKEIEALVVMTLYQIGYMDAIPNYAALNEGIALVPKKFGRLKGYVTWLCHEFIRDPKVFEKARVGFFPSWFAESLKESLGSKLAEELERRSLEVPEVYFESPVDFQIESPADFVFPGGKIFKAKHLSREERLSLESRGGIVCDLFSLLIPEFFTPLQEGTYLDLCSSPGGKLLKGLARFPLLKFHAVEIDAVRMNNLKHRLNRSPYGQKQIEFHEVDGRIFLEEAKNKGRYFSRILLDAPCSGLGTIVSHPEYLLSKKENVVDGLPEIQKELLLKALAVLEPGGELIYSVCTFTRAETEGHLDAGFHVAEIKSVALDLNAMIGSLRANFGTYLFPAQVGNQIFYILKFCREGLVH